MIYQFHSDLVLPLFVCADKHLAMKAVGESWMDYLPADNWNTEGIKEAMMLTNIFLLWYKHKCLSHLNTAHMNSFSERIPWVHNNLQQKLQTVIPFPYLSLWLRGARAPLVGVMKYGIDPPLIRNSCPGFDILAGGGDGVGSVSGGNGKATFCPEGWFTEAKAADELAAAPDVEALAMLSSSTSLFVNMYHFRNIQTICQQVLCIVFTLLTFEKLSPDSCDMYISWYIANTHINT